MRRHFPIILGEVALFGGAGLMEALGFTLPLWVWSTMFAIGTGGLIFWYGVLPLIVRRPARAVAATPSRAEPAEPAIHGDAVKGLISLVVILGILGGGGYGLTLVDWSRPDKIWRHPETQNAGKAVGDCEMRAYEAIGGGAMQNIARGNYVKSCMKHKGFEWVSDDG